ncbi:Sas10/Utp3/C1D family-domain-containing protein [Mycena amicta]|nr:Sas10/Utp3/C1D family-domain-containing protein [Mycena amicta]
MTTETTKLKAKLSALNASLSTLEDAIAPLLEQTLAETIVGLTSLEQAKLQTLIPYLVYDLVFIYLKAQGIDPKTHPVVAELNRVKKYFDKISSAENPDSETRDVQLDKGAATRFIKHAITQATGTTSKGKEVEPQTPQPSTFVPVRVTDKMRERAEYERELRERGDNDESEDEGLEIVDGDGDEVLVQGEVVKDKGKGKGKAVEHSHSVPEPVAGNKRRRPVVDPFAASGYGDDVNDHEPTATPPRTGTEDVGAEGSESSKKKNKKQKKDKETSSGAKSPKKKKKKTEK